MAEKKQNKPKIGIGYRVGKLTVEEATPQRRSGYTVWCCRCDCGGEILLDTRYLQRGTITDCGCATRVKPGQKDLTGLRFGKLVCIEPTEQRSKSRRATVWRCQCDCGNECPAPITQLTSGYKKSCGCLGHPPLKDYVKKLRQNNTIPGFSRDFVKNVLYNPVYMGKIAYGRRRTEKKQGTRNEMHVVEQSEFPVYEGQHEAIISEEDWYLAQEKRKTNSFKREKVNNPDHAHILSGILKCPCCGKSMYGNIAKAHSKDKKTRYYYYCKNTVTPTGHECSFRLNVEQTEINKFVAKIISAMVNNPRFVEAIQAKIGTAVDTEDMEKQIAVLQGQLKQAFGTKSRLERQMDTLDINDVHYDRKILDLQRRYDEQYDTIEEIEVQIGELQSQIRNIQQEKISGDNIYRLLLAFDEVYHSATEAEQKEFMKAFIERIEMFPEKRKDGSWIKKIVFNFPVPVDGEEVKELPLETETTVETVCLLTKRPD